jgi:hypothetical protein
MVKIIVVWMLLAMLLGVGVVTWCRLSGKEQWQLTKIIAIATMSSLAAVMLLVLIVMLF